MLFLQKLAIEVCCRPGAGLKQKADLQLKDFSNATQVVICCVDLQMCVYPRNAQQVTSLFFYYLFMRI